MVGSWGGYGYKRNCNEWNYSGERYVTIRARFSWVFQFDLVYNIYADQICSEFQPAVIKSIQTKRMPVKTVKAGQTASLALKKIKRNQIRKGMVLVSKSMNPVACRGM